MGRNKVIALSSIGGFLILCLLILLFFGWRYTDNLKIQIKERNEIIHSLFETNFVLDKTNLDLILSLEKDTGYQFSCIEREALGSRINSIELRKLHDVMQNYTASVYDKDYKKYSTFFSDTVQVFFLRTSFSVEDVFYNMKWYWNTFPNSEIQYDINSMSIDKNDDGYIVFIPCTKDGSDILGEIRFNKDMKIYYIKDYYALKDKKKKK